MRGKCATCEFFVGMAHPRKGTCHIRSIPGHWPERDKGDQCGEYQSNAASLKRQSCEGPEVHTGTRVEKSTERVEEPS
jgi:hypothetical protein